jgi:Zn-dependent membrane protease YugP
MAFFDPLWLLISLPALLLMLSAQARTQGAYSRYSAVPSAVGLPGWRVARAILDAHGLHDVEIQEVPGELTDHYDPTTRTLRLSPGVARVPSLAAAAIAAHETGHAIQHAAGYVPLRARAMLVPLVQLGSTIGWIALLFGFAIHAAGLVWTGVLLFASGSLFALVTLPVEFDASRRAMGALQALGLVTAAELDGASEVLSAAAWTYVAGFLQTVSQLFYFTVQALGLSRGNWSDSR